jgi:subtilisin family serine protease
MENWDQEKIVAINLIDGLGRNLTNLTVGVGQFSAYGEFYISNREDGSTLHAPVSSNLNEVKALVNNMTLRYGSTDFGSPLAMCYNQLEQNGYKDQTGKVTPVRFCILVTDGVPDESATYTSPSIEKLCLDRGITKPSPTLAPMNIQACTGINRADVIVAVDVAPQSIVSSEWAVVTSFLQALVRALPIGSDSMRLGVVTFAQTAALVQGLSSDKAALSSSIAKMTASAQATRNIAPALTLADVQLTSAAARAVATKVVLFVCFGHPADRAATATAMAKAKASGYVLLIVAAGDAYQRGWDVSTGPSLQSSWFAAAGTYWISSASALESNILTGESMLPNICKQVPSVSTGAPTTAPSEDPSAKACTMRNVMYDVKKAGYIIFGIYVATLGASDATIKKGKNFVNIYSSCESPICPLTCEFCTKGDIGCVDNEELLRLRSTVPGQNMKNGVAQPFFTNCAAAKANSPLSLCDYAGETQTFSVTGDYTNGIAVDLDIDLGRWEYGYAQGGHTGYLPGLRFAKQAGKPLNSNLAADGRCLYYADSRNMTEFNSQVQIVVDNLVRTVAQTTLAPTPTAAPTLNQSSSPAPAMLDVCELAKVEYRTPVRRTRLQRVVHFMVLRERPVAPRPPSA